MLRELTPKAIGRIKGNLRVIGLLVSAFNKHQKTIEGWIETNDVRLTLPEAVDIISKGTGLTQDEILRVPKVAA